MTEYIEREAVKTAIMRVNANLTGLLGFVDAIPAADVATMRHGHWIEKDDDLYCSECNRQIPDCAGNANPIFTSDNHFCYYCGARMDCE